MFKKKYMYKITKKEWNLSKLNNIFVTKLINNTKKDLFYFYNIISIRLRQLGQG